jgi:NAD(P)-dependent dehydrogenase (short-subunit alcohol dehydrogenase family)
MYWRWTSPTRRRWRRPSRRSRLAAARSDVLANCAGFELAGTVEEIPAAEVRRQFDTNVFGPARLAVPGMRAQRYGRIINTSSVFGRFAVPGGAYDAASKHAVAAFSETLRRELAGSASGSC